MPSGTKLVISKGCARKTWTNQLDFLKRVVMPSLKKAEYSVLFSVKVNPQDFPEYPKIVSKPMDFSVIENRLKEHYYTCGAECVDDIETVFANCCIFNQAAEDITLIGEHMIRKKYIDKMVDFPKQEIPIEKKKRGPGRRRPPASPESDVIVTNRRNSLESVESQSNTNSYIGNDTFDSNSANGEKKAPIRNALISRITKDQSSTSAFKISSAPRRDREARPQMSSGAPIPGASAVGNSKYNKPNLRLSPSLTKCQKMIHDITSFRRRRFNWPFLEPVDPETLGIPDYFDIVKNPIDLSTIKRKLDHGLYKHKDEVKADIDLMVANCTLYNGPNSEISICGQELLGFFNNKFVAIAEDPPDTPPFSDGKRKRNKSHKTHKQHKRHRRDRVEDEVLRLRGLNPDTVQEMHPEEQNRLRNVLSQLEEVLMRMDGRATEYDQNVAYVTSNRDRMEEEPIPALQSIEPSVKEMCTDLAHLRSLQAALHTSPISNGSGRPAGRPRKRALLNDGDDADFTPTGKSSGARGKRKRLTSLQPCPPAPEEQPARLPPITAEESALFVRKPTVKPVVKDVPPPPPAAAATSSSAPQFLLKKDAAEEEKPNFQETSLNPPEILTYNEKTDLSVELQRITDTTVLQELGAIVQQYEPNVRGANSDELDVDLTALSNETLTALKQVLNRVSAPTSVAPPPNVSPPGVSPVAKAMDVKSDSEEELDEEYEENSAEPQLTTSSEMPPAEEPGLMGAPESAGIILSAKRLYKPDVSTISSDNDSSVTDSKPRSRRHARKTSHPVRHRGAGTVVGANSSLMVPECEKSGSETATETDTTVPMIDSAADDGLGDTDFESTDPSNLPPEDVPDHMPSTTFSPPPPPLVKPTRDHGKKNPIPKALPSGSKRVRADRKPEMPQDPKMETSTPRSKQSPGLSHFSSDEDNLGKCDSDNEAEQSPRGSDEESKPLGQPVQHRTVYEIFSDDQAEGQAARRRNAPPNEDPLLEIQTKYKSLIFNNKSERINRELERENEVRERREEEEKRKRDDEERKRKEEQEKEARKEALKEQERRRLNEIRARNRRADMPLRQYADMANFEKQLDYSLINPRWF